MAKAKKAAKAAAKKKTSASKSAKGSKSAKAKKAVKTAKSAKSAAKAKPKAKAKAKAKATKAVSKAKSKKVAKVALKATPQPKGSGKVKAPKGKAPKDKAKKVTAPVVEELEAGELLMEQPPEEVVLTDAEGRRYCRVKDCDQLAMVDAYCRYHYLLYWKRIQVRKKILTEGKLERYIEELTARYPDKFLEMLRKDLRSEKEFVAAIQELEIDETQGDSDFEEESENFIEEVRGASETSSAADDDF